MAASSKPSASRTRLEGGKVRIDAIRGQPFDPGKTYSVATNDFLAAGGDGYKVFKEKGKNLYNSGPVISDLLINYVSENKVITQQLLDSLK